MATRVLIAGVSTRGFAESAARAGYHVVAVDGFGDLDLRAWAATVLVARPKGGTRFSVGAALRAARGVSRDVVTYLASFENHPAAVGALARPARSCSRPTGAGRCPWESRASSQATARSARAASDTAGTSSPTRTTACGTSSVGSPPP